MFRVILVLIFLTAVSFFWLLYQLFFHSKAQIQSRLREDVGIERNTHKESTALKEASNIQERLQRTFATTKVYRKMQLLIAKSYVKMHPGELLNLSLLGGVFLFLAIWLLQDNLLFAVLGLALGILAPSNVLRIIGTKRAKQMNAQLPHALGILSNGIRVGFSFPQAMGVVVREMEAPIAEEFDKVLRDSQLGKPMDEALSDFGDRTDDEDLSIFITTLLTQMQVGGDLAEILDIIANTIRERIELKGQIRVLTSQSKFSAIIISALPVAIAVILFFMNPEYMMVLFTEPLGLVMVVGAGFMMILGIAALFKIVNIKV